MKHLPTIAGVLLGLGFIFSGAAFFLIPVDQMPPPPPADTPAGMFFGAFAPTGYFNIVKLLEIVGGLLVAIPKTRNLGLLILGPILINILLFHGLVAKAGLFSPMIVVLTVLTLYLLWAERRTFAKLLH